MSCHTLICILKVFATNRFGNQFPMSYLPIDSFFIQTQFLSTPRRARECVFKWIETSNLFEFESIVKHWMRIKKKVNKKIDVVIVCLQWSIVEYTVDFVHSWILFLACVNVSVKKTYTYTSTLIVAWKIKCKPDTSMQMHRWKRAKIA